MRLAEVHFCQSCGYSKRPEKSGRDFQRETSARCLARSASVKAADTVNGLKGPGGAISANAGFAVRSVRFYMRKNSCACERRFRSKEFRRDFPIANCRAISRDECRIGRHEIRFHSRCYSSGLKSHGGIFRSRSQLSYCASKTRSTCMAVRASKVPSEHPEKGPLGRGVRTAFLTGPRGRGFSSKLFW